MPLTADLLDSKDILDTCSDSAAGYPPAEGLGETLEGGDGTKEPPSENINLVVDEPSLKLKHLETEFTPVLVSQSNININVSKQEEVVKLTDKCLNNVIESPVNTSMRLPPDIKSNILKAQVEAGHKVVKEGSISGNKNTNIQDTAGSDNSALLSTAYGDVSHHTPSPCIDNLAETQNMRSVFPSGNEKNSPLRTLSPVCQEPLEGLKVIPVTNAFILNEFNENTTTPESKDCATDLVPREEDVLVKSSSESMEILLTSQTKNLIDFTEAMPQVPSPIIMPRWLVPVQELILLLPKPLLRTDDDTKTFDAGVHISPPENPLLSGLTSNGPLGNDVTLSLKTTKINTEALLATDLSPPLYPSEITPSPVTEDTTRQKCLLTTEL